MAASAALAVGDPAPDFELPSSTGETIRLSDYRVKSEVVLYFYPKDDTTGCTNEAKAFTELAPEFAKAGATVLGVSKDSVKSHAKFADKYGLKVKLGADVEGKVVEGYGVWGEKSLYGRKYMGIDRATFLIDKDGVVAKVWRKVKVPGHVDAVREALQAL